MKKSPLKRKTPLRKTAKTHTRGWYSRKLDELAKRFAKERDGYICQFSGEKVEGSNAHGSHVIPVSAGLTLRWDLENIKCLSYHNHINWWHKNPMESSAWFRDKFPERWEYLQSMKSVKLNLPTPKLIEFYEVARKCSTWKEYRKAYRDMMA